MSAQDLLLTLLGGLGLDPVLHTADLALQNVLLEGIVGLLHGGLELSDFVGLVLLQETVGFVDVAGVGVALLHCVEARVARFHFRDFDDLPFAADLVFGGFRHGSVL